MEQKEINNSKGIAHLVLIVVVVLVAVGALYWYLSTHQFNLNSLNPFAPKNTSQDMTNYRHPREGAVIRISASGFTPQVVQIQKGQSVQWINNDSNPHQIASDPHPTHTGYPGLESNALIHGDSFTFTFDKTGKFGYHDHLNPLKLLGTVIVK